MEAGFQKTGFMTKFPGNFQFHINFQHPISPNTSSLYQYLCQVGNSKSYSTSKMLWTTQIYNNSKSMFIPMKLWYIPTYCNCIQCTAIMLYSFSCFFVSTSGQFTDLRQVPSLSRNFDVKLSAKNKIFVRKILLREFSHVFQTSGHDKIIFWPNCERWIQNSVYFSMKHT